MRGKTFGLVDTGALLRMLPSVVLMAVVGPVFNTAISIIALQDKYPRQKSDVSDEVFKLSVGHMASGLLGGFPVASDNSESDIF